MKSTDKTTDKSMRASDGYTLVEVAVAMSMLVLMIGGAYTSVSQAGDSWTSVVTKTKAQNESRACINEVAEDLKQAGNIWLDKTTYDYTDVVRFQMPLGIDSVGDVLWGARESLTGLIGSRQVTKQQAWWVEYRVHQNRTSDGKTNWQLIKTYLDGTGNYTGKKVVIANHIDKPRDSKGFAISRSGDLYSIRIRLGFPTDKEAFGTPETRVLLKSTVMTRNWKWSDGLTATPPTPTLK